MATATKARDGETKRPEMKAETKSKKKAGAAGGSGAKGVKAHVLTPAEMERRLPEMPDEKHMRLMQDASSHPDQSCIGVNLIDVRPGNRDPSEFTPEALAELMRSIAQHGLLQPIVVRKKSDKGRFELIAGQRRLAAYKLLGLSAIPAITRECASDGPAPDELRLAENIDRKPLSFFEEAEQVEALYVESLARDPNSDGFIAKDAGHLVAKAAVKAVSIRLGKSEYWVRERLMLAGLDEKIRGAVLDGTLSLSVARKLAQIECAEDRAAAAKAITQRIAQKYRGLPTTDEIDRLIGEYLYRLQGVKWRLDVPFAGKPACDTCEHNSNNSLWRFEQLTKDGKPVGTFRDGAAATDRVGDDRVAPKEGVCSNGACYRVKAEQAKGAVDRAAARAVTHLSRQAEASLGAKASPRKVAEQALVLAKRPAVTAGIIPEGISGAAVLERVRPKLERMSESIGTSKKPGDVADALKQRKDSDEKYRKAERAAKDEYGKITEKAIGLVQAPLLAELAKDTTRALIVEMVATLPAVEACASYDQRARTAALKKRELDETLAIIAMEPVKALRAIAGIRFGKTGLGKHNPLSAESREIELAYYPTAFVVVMQKIARLLGAAVPDVTLEDEDKYIKRRTEELLNPKPAEEPADPAAKPRVPKVASARKSSANRARVPDVDVEEEPPRGAGDVARDEAGEGSDEE